MDIQTELKNIILKEIGAESLPAEMQDKLLEKIGGIILKEISLVILESLPEEAWPEFETISASGDDIKMQKFLRSKIANFDDLVQKTIKNTIEEYKQLAVIK